MKSFDYKSIALPAELQGHNLIIKFFSLINQLKQSIINAVSVHNLSVAHTIKVTYVWIMIDLLVLNGVPIKTIKK